MEKRLMEETTTMTANKKDAWMLLESKHVLTKIKIDSPITKDKAVYRYLYKDQEGNTDEWAMDCSTGLSNIFQVHGITCEKKQLENKTLIQRPEKLNGVPIEWFDDTTFYFRSWPPNKSEDMTKVVNALAELGKDIINPKAMLCSKTQCEVPPVMETSSI